MKPRALVLWMLATSAVACGRVGPAGPGGGAALMRNALRSRTLEIVAEERELHDALERAAARLRAADDVRRFDAVVTEGFPLLARTTPRIVVGTRKSGRAALLALRIGVVLSAADVAPSFRFGNAVFESESEAFIATFEDPERPGLPVTLVFANDVDTAAALCTKLDPAWKPWLTVLHGSRIVRDERLQLDGSRYPSEPTLDPRIRAAREARLARVEAVALGVDVRAANGIAPDVLTRYLAACGTALERARAWIGANEQRAPVELCVWSEAADYLADGDTGALSRSDPILGRTDALVLESSDDGGAGIARTLARVALGAPAQPWMCDAAGVEAAWSWWGRELDPWLARVAGGGRAIELADIVSANVTEHVSPHVISPLRAAFWRFLRETQGDEFVRSLWRGTRNLDTSSTADAAFARWLDTRIAGARIDHEPRRAAARASDREFELLRGIGACAFDPLSERLDARGFASSDFEAMLDAARQIGTDALLVTAYAVDRPGADARFGNVRPSLVASREGDVRIAAALFAGAEREMRTVLAANLLAGDGGTWSGTWSRNQESGWVDFFDRYTSFVEHHAALAELCGATILSLGTGIADVTSTATAGRRFNELEAEWKQAGWKRVIATARRTFSGLLTYTAGSTLELERVPFFEQLDFVALEISPTLELDDLRDGVDARAEIEHQLDVAFVALEKKARSTGKRILFTELSFSPALEGAAQRFGDGHTSVDWHAQQFLTFAERLKIWTGTPLVAGVFAWRFGSGRDEPDYTTAVDSPRVHDAVRVLFQSLPPP